MANDLGVKGNILFEAGRYDEAMATFDKEAKLIEGSSYPQSVKDYFALNHHIETALVSMKKKDFKTAAAECAAVQKGEESMGPPALQRAAHVIAGRLAFEKKEYDKALAELHQGDPASAYNLYLISLAYMGKGDKADAKEFCTKAAHSYAVQNLSYAFIRGKAEKMLLSL
jgi:tetratricopeptide (TPR) repeat protein